MKRIKSDTCNNEDDASQFKTNIKTDNYLWFWVTLAISALTVIAVFMIPIDEYPWAYLRNMLGLVFVFFLPGFALTKCLFRSNPPFKLASKELELIESFALSIGLSIALTSFVGIIIYYSPLEYSLNSILLSIFALTLFLASVSVFIDFKQKRKIISK